MGCKSSKSVATLGSDRERGGLISRSLSMARTHKKSYMQYDFHVVALTSSTYGIMKLVESENMDRGLAAVIAGARGDGPMYKKMKKWDSMPPSREEGFENPWSEMEIQSPPDEKFSLVKKKLEGERKPLRDTTNIYQYEEPEVINTWELMEGLDDVTPRISPFFLQPRDASTVNEVHNVEKTTLATVRVRSLERTRSLSSIDALTGFDTSILSHLEINPAPTPSANAKDGVRTASNAAGHREHRVLPSIEPSVESDLTRESNRRAVPRNSFIPKSPGQLREDSNADNLFDPDIVAAFASSIERTSSDDGWYNGRGCDGEGSASSSASTTDDDSPIGWAFFGGHHDTDLGRSVGETGLSRTEFEASLGGGGIRKISSSKISPLNTEDRKPIERPEPLEKFEKKCPPGAEERVVLYTTSLRGIRKTFENCSSLRMILQGFSVRVDERDLAMHAEFRQELKDLLGKQVSVPRVFIKGCHIGGIEEVLQLHEEGRLAELVKGMPTETTRRQCDGCGGVRFVPCPECSGSCKVLTCTNKVARCPDCNENGLIRCPLCF